MSPQHILQTAEPATAAFRCQRSPPHRVLVVDDEAMMRTFNAEVLTSYGYRVDAAEDGALAWDRLQIESYDLLITDNVMPKVSGIQLIEKVHAARMALPVILAAGALPKNDFIQCPGSNHLPRWLSHIPSPNFWER
jgi:CheY-like chemotaxis protein